MDTIGNSSDRLLDRFSDADMVEQQNIDFYRKNQSEIEEKYGGNVIAIIDGEVVDESEPSEEFEFALEFVGRLEQEYGRDKALSAYITFVPEV